MSGKKSLVTFNKNLQPKEGEYQSREGLEKRAHEIISNMAFDNDAQKHENKTRFLAACLRNTTAIWAALEKENLTDTEAAKTFLNTVLIPTRNALNKSLNPQEDPSGLTPPTT
jgi:hypothetical protein